MSPAGEVAAAALTGERRLTAARAALGELRDPEIPTVSIADLGMIHSIQEEGETLVVELLPTLSGCPAVAVIEAEARQALTAAGLEPVRVLMRADLPWSTTMITEAGRRQIAEFGLVPPQRRQLKAEEIACPRCGERQVTLVSRFGPTPCRALARCRACSEPLEVFKPIG